MAFCTKCGASLPDESKFCPYCGAQNGAGSTNTTGQVQTGKFSFSQRNIAVAIILTIVTCGIYGIYWLIKMVDEINEAAGEQNAMSGGLVFLLSIVTCGIYLYIWLYKAGEMLNKAKAARGLPVDKYSGLIYLLLAIFGFSIVSYGLIQNELNTLAA